MDIAYIVEEIIEEMYEGSSLSKALKKLEIRPRIFFDYLHNHPDTQVKYADAQRARSELHVEEIIEIADTEVDSLKARNKIDARRWYASKMQPQKYGDKLDLNVQGNIDLTAALADARNRVSLPIPSTKSIDYVTNRLPDSNDNIDIFS